MASAGPRGGRGHAGGGGVFEQRGRATRRPRGTNGVESTSPPRPDGPAADLSTELTGGGGVFMGEATTDDLGRGRLRAARVRRGRNGDVVPARRRAHRRRPVDSSQPDAQPRRTAPGSSCARRPNPPTFSGTVVVEWLNVSGGVDADPEWASLHEEIVRAGDTWVGVSAQQHRRRGRPGARDGAGVAGADDAGQGPQGDRSRRATDARAPGRRLLVRHLHPGRARPARRRRASAGCSRSG